MRYGFDQDCDLILSGIDPDDDNNGVADVEDAFPLDPSENRDSDSDGTGGRANADNGNESVDDTIAAAVPSSSDGNGDGTADSLQSHVASIKAHAAAADICDGPSPWKLVLELYRFFRLNMCL